MPLPGLAVLSPDADLNAVKNYIIRLERKLSFLLENGLDTDNIFEAGGWRVGENRLASKDGDVGMSSADDAPDPIRLWAGSTNKEAAPWRVYKSGKSVMTGALIQSQSGYPKVVIDPNGDYFGAYSSATKHITINPYFYTGNGVVLTFTDGTYDSNIYQSGDQLVIHSGEIQIDSDLYAIGGAGFWTSSIYNYRYGPFGASVGSEIDDLWDALAGKATSGVSTGLSGGHNHGIPDGTVLMVQGGGTVTFFSAPQHSHAQV